MIDTALVRTTAESATEAAGSSLVRSLYKIPVTIGLSGALGSGKTAFMRGFLRQCGITDAVTSPTYALEQRYKSVQRGEILHIDLYRLEQAEAALLLHASEHHPDIRCIEWPEKAGKALNPDIRVTIEEQSNGHRSIKIACNDVSWPDDATILAWRKELLLPENVGAHCDAVGEFCRAAAEALVARGTFARPQLARAAGKTHDLLRFMDFHGAAAPAGWTSSTDEESVWRTWKARYYGMTHEAAGHAFLTERGYPALAEIVGAHHISVSLSARTTTEQHLLYYADKRFIGDRLVSVAGRYEDFAQRYGKGSRSAESVRWEQEAIETEHLLFPDGPPV